MDSTVMHLVLAGLILLGVVVILGGFGTLMRRRNRRHRH
ncbi:hypothetical protein HNR25_005126 [Streptomonospora salina]|uniref:Uncharacterized protein n=1 Tax=Streptomonospora salina TaxID=104205 RepID=A0A841EB59_9ACTN|nr:hypothetical protein [Streptomonospora salina]